MKLDELFTDDKAVSPVVGVALLIAMTVILAAVIGTVVLGLGSNPAQAPQATFDFEQLDTGDVEIVHDGGDAIPGDEITIMIDGSDSGVTVSDEWTAGESETVSPASGARVSVVWEDSDSDKTSTLAEYEVP